MELPLDALMAVNACSSWFAVCSAVGTLCQASRASAAAGEKLAAAVPAAAVAVVVFGCRPMSMSMSILQRVGHGCML
jgi:hypothetical protein